MRFLIAVSALTLASAPAHAGDRYVVQPVQVGLEQVRYLKGNATVVLNTADGGVQIKPLGFDHGALTFAIAVYNDAALPANFDISNIGVTINGTTVAVQPRAQLEKAARRRAMWSQIGMAALGGVAAAAAASATETHTYTYHTRYGSGWGSYTQPSAAGQVAAAGITAGTGYAMVKMQEQLDRTLEALSEGIVQLTTVDPHDSYGGRIVLNKVRFDAKAPTRVDMRIDWNGRVYPFAFQIAAPGTPAPRFTTVAAPTPTQPVPSEASAGTGTEPPRLPADTPVSQRR